MAKGAPAAMVVPETATEEPTASPPDSPGYLLGGPVSLAAWVSSAHPLAGLVNTYTAPAP